MNDRANSSTETVAEAIRTLRLKLDVRKERIWSPQYSFSAEIGEVETLIAEVERLRRELDMAHDQIRSLQSKAPPRTEPIRTHVREG